LEKADKLSPTAHFAQIDIAENTFGKKRMEKHQADTHYPAKYSQQ
jgi:hypothetical protein